MVAAFWPEITITFFALILFVLDLVVKNKRVLLGVGFAAILVAGFGLIFFQHVPKVWSMIVLDGTSQFLKGIILLSMALVFLLSLGYDGLDEERLGPYTILLLFSTLGMMLIVSANDFLLLLIALELIGIPSFILTGFLFQEARSAEGAIKYFLVGAFSAALSIYGISLLYGLCGSTGLTVIAARIPHGNPLFIIAVLLAVAGLAFEISVVPFHTWVPESYEGAPTPITAYLSVAPKAATMVALLRIFTTVFPLDTLSFSLILAVLSAVTMSVGNLAALFQDNVKRMLGYSSIAQMGYVLMGVVVAGQIGHESVLLYLLVYTFMNLGAFTLVIAISNELGSDHIDRYKGLAQRSLVYPLLLVIFLLSLAGIPPLAGFIGKFYLFAGAISSDWVWLAGVAVINSVVSVYYYLRFAKNMFFADTDNREPLKVDFSLRCALAVTASCTILIGIFPNGVIELVQHWAMFMR